MIDCTFPFSFATYQKNPQILLVFWNNPEVLSSDSQYFILQLCTCEVLNALNGLHLLSLSLEGIPAHLYFHIVFSPPLIYSQL